jgi:enoyl-CoA hydratase/carnithine racemase
MLVKAISCAPAALRGARALSSADSSITHRLDGRVGTLCLNRPSKLNALDLPMVRALREQYDRWVVSGRDDGVPEVACIVMRGAGGKAFCAGGDVAAVQRACLAGMPAAAAAAAGAGSAGTAPGYLPADFFFEEYQLNAIIATMHAARGVAQIALWDGITMGGGVGLSVHGRFRVATERTLFAKPETAIGLFPDVGGTHMLPRLAGAVGGAAAGLYVGLTGVRLRAADCLASGLATHYVPSARLAELDAELARLDDGSGGGGGGGGGGGAIWEEEALDEMLVRLGGGAAPPEPEGGALLAPHADAIRRCFGGGSGGAAATTTAEEIVERLRAEPGEWAAATLASLTRMSPTSVKLTIAACARHGGEGVSISTALEQEYRLSQRCMRPQPHSDFREGIRAVLIDKAPASAVWDPPTLAGVTAEHVGAFFAPLESDHPRGELVLPRMAPPGPR